MIPRELSEASARPHKCRNNLLIRESRSEQIFKQTVKTSVGRCPKVVCDDFSQTLPRRWSFFSFFFLFARARSSEKDKGDITSLKHRPGRNYRPRTVGENNISLPRVRGSLLFPKKPRTPKSHFAVGMSGILRRGQRKSLEVRSENFPPSRREDRLDTSCVHVPGIHLVRNFRFAAGSIAFVSSIPLSPLFPRQHTRVHRCVPRWTRSPPRSFSDSRINFAARCKLFYELANFRRGRTLRRFDTGDSQLASRVSPRELLVSFLVES